MILFDESKQLHDYMNDLFNEIAGNRDGDSGVEGHASTEVAQVAPGGRCKSVAAEDEFKAGAMPQLGSRYQARPVPFKLIKGGKDD